MYVSVFCLLICVYIYTHMHMHIHYTVHTHTSRCVCVGVSEIGYEEVLWPPLSAAAGAAARSSCLRKSATAVRASMTQMPKAVRRTSVRKWGYGCGGDGSSLFFLQFYKALLAATEVSF